MALPIFSSFTFVVSHDIIKTKLHLTPEEYIKRLDFSNLPHCVASDDYLVVAKAPNPDNFLADRFIQGLDLNETNYQSKDFTIVSFHHPNILLWEVDYLMVHKVFVVHRDQFLSVKDKLDELSRLPMRKFFEYTNNHKI